MVGLAKNERSSTKDHLGCNEDSPAGKSAGPRGQLTYRSSDGYLCATGLRGKIGRDDEP